MVASVFRKQERAQILSHLEEWQALKGRGKERDEDGDLFSPRDRLIDDIVYEFFQMFPERDFFKDPTHELVFKQQDRDRLHSVGVRFLLSGIC